MNFILNHLGHNYGSEWDFDTWKKDIEDLAALPNVFAKLGACEMWGKEDPQPYLEHALKTFGWHRCLYESNWFVNQAWGDNIDKTFLATHKACIDLGADQIQMDAVFKNNAVRVYRI